jgi:hypothetical protein
MINKGHILVFRVEQRQRAQKMVAMGSLETSRFIISQVNQRRKEALDMQEAKGK